MRIVHKGLLSSIGGVIYLDRSTLQYRVFWIPSDLTESWPETSSIFEYELEVIGNMEETVPYYPESSKIVRALLDDATKVMIRELLIDKEYFYFNPVICEAATFSNVTLDSYQYVYYNYNDDTGLPIYQEDFHSIAVCLTNIKNKYQPRVDIHEDPHAYLRYHSQTCYEAGYPFIDIDDKIKILPVNVSVKDGEYNIKLYNRGPGYNLELIPEFITVDSNIQIRRPILVYCKDLSEDLSSIYFKEKLYTLYEGDKVYSDRYPNVYGYIRYRPKTASFMVEIPENLMARDFIFDGYMPLVDGLIESYEYDHPKAIWHLKRPFDRSIKINNEFCS